MLSVDLLNCDHTMMQMKISINVILHTLNVRRGMCVVKYPDTSPLHQRLFNCFIQLVKFCFAIHKNFPQIYIYFFLYLNSIKMEFSSFLLLILFVVDFCFPCLGIFEKYYLGCIRWKKLELPHLCICQFYSTQGPMG